MTTIICTCPFASRFPQYNLQQTQPIVQHTTLHEDIDAYLLHLKATGRATSTIICYKGYLVRLSGLLGEVETCQITDRTLEQSVVRLQGQFPCSEITQNKIRSIYRSLFQWLFESGQIASNPAALLHLARTTPNYTTPITQNEVAILLDAIRDSNHPLAKRDELLIALYAFTGIRRSEALRLRVEDYDTVTKTLHLRNTKGGGYRLQPIPKQLVHILEEYVERLQHNAIQFIFPGENGVMPLSTRQVHSRFIFWKQTASIRNSLTIHSFRAGYATHLYHATGDIWLVSQALGHSGLQTIRHYIQADAMEIHSAADKAFDFVANNATGSY
jgi:site-specific recombinase XerD